MTSAEQTQQIISVAREQLSTVGASGLSLSAVASDSGISLDEVTGDFAHRDDLLTALIIDAYNASGEALEAADNAARVGGAGPGARLLAAARGLRDWSIANPGEFALLYGSPVPGYDAPQETVPPASRTPAVLAGIVRTALENGMLTPAQREIPGPPLILPAAIELFGGTPEEPFRDLLERGIVLWSNLIGLLIFEIFGRTHDSVRDQTAFFDYGIAVAAESVGLAVLPNGEKAASA
jgi:AcrR family transcriptional regulator